MERVNWNQAVRPSTHDLIAAINSGADDIERIDGALDDIETALDGKAGVSGTYPDFMAGEALSIRSGIRSNTFLSRALDTDVADGIAEVDRILGNTVVWNQLFKKNANISGGTSITANNDGSYTIGELSTTHYINALDNLSSMANHKVFIAINADGILASNITFFFEAVNYRERTVFEPNNSAARIVTLPSNAGIPTVSVLSGNYNITIKPEFIDLTQTYGAGNEPATVEQFKQQYPEDYYAYTPTPYLLSSNIAGIEGAGACEFPAQTLRGVYGHSDVMTKDGVETAIAETTVNIVRISENTNVDYAVVNKPSNSAGRGNWAFRRHLIQGFSTNTTAGVNIGAASNVGIVYDGANINEIWIGVTKGTTLAQAQEMLNGLPMYYELATHVFTPFAEPLDLTYRVQADGSEAWIVPEGTQSAAVTGEIGYPLDPAHALITHESFADFCDKLGAYIGATITETWDGSKYTYSFASGRSALLGSIDAEPDALEVTEKDDMVKEIIEDERKEL